MVIVNTEFHYRMCQMHENSPTHRMQQLKYSHSVTLLCFVNCTFCKCIFTVNKLTVNEIENGSEQATHMYIKFIFTGIRVYLQFMWNYLIILRAKRNFCIVYIYIRWIWMNVGFSLSLFLFRHWKFFDMYNICAMCNAFSMPRNKRDTRD